MLQICGLGKRTMPTFVLSIGLPFDPFDHMSSSVIVCVQVHACVHACVFCIYLCVCMCMCACTRRSRQHQGRAACTYSVSNKPVRGIPIFISWLFTLSSDNACQISPQDFLKKTISPHIFHTNDNNKTAAAPAAANKSSNNCFLVGMACEQHYKLMVHDSKEFMGIFCNVIDSSNKQHLIYYIVGVLPPTISSHPQPPSAPPIPRII